MQKEQMYTNKKALLIIKYILLCPFSLFLWLLLIVSCGIFAIYRTIVDAILRRKYGKNYGGLLNIADSLLVMKDIGKYIITTILIVKCEKKTDIFKIVEDRFKNKVFDYPRHYPKLTSTQHTFGGYSYWIRDSYEISDCITKMFVSGDKEFNERYLAEMTGKIYSEPFPKNDTGSWDVRISQEPLKNNKNDEFYYYPIIIRFDHVIGDGISLIALLIDIFGNTNVEEYNKIMKKLSRVLPENNYENKLPFDKLQIFLREIIDFFALGFYILFIGVGKSMINGQFRSDDHSELHGTELSGKKMFAWHVETDVKYLPMVKEIKSRVPNTKFINVIMAAVSASLSNFFKRKSQPVPNKATTLLTSLLDFPLLESSKPARLDNKTILSMIELSLHESNSITGTLNHIRLNTEDVKYGDIVVFSIMASKIVGIFPLSMRTKFVGPLSHTSLITNIPGGIQIPITEGCVLEKIIPFAPHIKKIGVTVTVLSYNDRFQLGVLVDQAILSSQEEVQQIADNVFENIKLLHMETRKIYKSSLK